MMRSRAQNKGWWSTWSVKKERVYVHAHMRKKIFSPVSMKAVFKTHIFREVQQCKHKEQVLLSVQQRTVVEVAVIPPISECELQGECLKVSAYVDPGV